MYVVIFKAKIKQLDAEYEAMASRMRELACKEYGCTEFVSCNEGDQEIAISYWPSEEHIRAWHQNPEHRVAQALGKSRWYHSYEVSVSKLVR